MLMMLGEAFLGMDAGATEASRRPIEVQRVTGEVIEVAPDSLVLRAGKERFRFELDAQLGLESSPRRIRRGDVVTVWYAFDAKGIKIHRAGRASPEARPPGKQDRHEKKPGIIIDDRAYYPAKRDEGPDENHGENAPG